jgi:glyoxylase-like metal-dependent hydrolase (beta-lactamase superfamily II)
MVLPSPRQLEDLSDLDRSLVYIFLAGPGQGEGIAVALPRQGWVLIDGCSVSPGSPSKEYPIKHVLTRWRSGDTERDPVMGVLLTHPHKDHVEGLAELLEDFSPNWVAVTGTDPVSRHLAADARSWFGGSRDALTSRRVRAQSVLWTLQAIETWVDRTRGRLVPLNDETTLPIGGSGISMRCRSPDHVMLEQYWTNRQIQEIAQKKPNWLSTVVEVGFGQTRVVLGGDLPVTIGSSDVPTGWNHVMRKYPALSQHAGLKLPHHGSREALHEALLSQGSSGRAWMLTPYNSSGLPRHNDGDGLDVILRQNEPLMLTSLALPKRLQPAWLRGRLSRAEIATARNQLRANGLFGESDQIVSAGTAVGPLDAIWCLAFDQTGTVVGRWRGPAAVDVVSNSSR